MLQGYEHEASDEAVRDPIPDDPLPHLARWLDEAKQRSGQANPDAIALATIGVDGHPQARMVLARGFDAERGVLVFYTDRSSRKGLALATHPNASAVFFWDALQRQVRIRGPVTQSPDDESDAYFAARPRASQLAATASRQSQPIESRSALLERIAAAEAAQASDAPVPRPDRWGGFRLWIREIELWAGSPGRAHDRAEWQRELDVTNGHGAFDAGPWSGRRLQP